MKDAVLLSAIKAIAEHQSRIVFLDTKLDTGRHWPYVGCDLDRFYDTLTEVGERLGCLPNTVEFFNITPTKKFLDIGCGTGLTLHIARALGFDAYGLETDPTTLKLLDATHGRTKHVLVEDALSFKKYGDFQVLFMYRPFRDEQVQLQLEQRVMASMQKNAILIPQHLISIKHLWIKI